MKVLLIHQHFNTPEKGGALRSYFLAKALVDRGVTTIVVTRHNEKKYRQEMVDGIEVHYFPVAYDNSFGFYRRASSFLKFTIASIRFSSRIKDVDLCYAISVPITVGISARVIKTTRKIPYFFEVGDLWPDAPVQLGFVKNGALKTILYALEKSIYKNAQTVVALSEPIKESIQRKAPSADIAIIPNMADTDFFRPGSKDGNLEAKYNVQGHFVVSYIGAVGFANGLDYYLECARASLRAGLAVKFVLCGEGAMLEGLKEFAKRLSLTNLIFIQHQGREGVKEVLNISDACFICYRPIPILETGSPNKYFDALAAGKLIIINFKGWIKEEIEKERCGFSLDASAPHTIVNQLKLFLEDQSILRSYQSAARNLAERNYSRHLLSERFYNTVIKAQSGKKLYQR